jgi:predicted TIM-barrel fold metal-dependent hydrolase
VIVDAHVHLMQLGRDFGPALAEAYLQMYRGVPSWRSGAPYTVDDWCVPPETLLADMDAAGVDRSVVMTLGSAPLGGHDPSLAEDVAVWCRDHPDRFVGMLTADPLGGEAEARRIRREVPRLGLTGVKLLPAYSYVAIDDPRLRPLYAAAAELDVPVVLHTGWCAIPGGRTLEHDHPLQAEAALAEFPGLRLVVAHCGFAWSEQVLFMLAGHPSVHADLAYWSQTMPAWRAAQTLSHAKHLGVLDRLLWGTDYPFASPADDLTYWRSVPDAGVRAGLEPALTPADMDGFLGRNATRAFGLSL